MGVQRVCGGIKNPSLLHCSIPGFIFQDLVLTK